MTTLTLGTGRLSATFRPGTTRVVKLTWPVSPGTGFTATLGGEALPVAGTTNMTVTVPGDVTEEMDRAQHFVLLKAGEPVMDGTWLPTTDGEDAYDDATVVVVGDIEVTVEIQGIEDLIVPGGGDMLAANNLTDLDDPAAARDALELGTAALEDIEAFRPAGPDLGTAAFADVGDFDSSDAASSVLTSLQTDPDPFPQYQQESARGVASGYPTLDGSGKVPVAQLPTGTSGSTVALGNAPGQALADAEAFVASTFAAFVASGDPLAQYQLKAARGAANGYAPLDGSSLIPDANIPSGIARDLEVTNAVAAEATARDAAIGTAIANLVGTAPGILDTLGEIAAQLSTDESAVSALTTTVAGKQATHANLTALSNLTGAANTGFYFTGSGAMATFDLSTFARTILDDADASTVRATVGLVIGTDVQAHDADLDAIALLTTTPFGRGLLGVADAAGLRSSAGLGTAATTAATDYQPVDSDLTSFAGLTPSNDDVVQRKGGAWVNRTIAQLKTDLALTTTDTVQFATLGLGAAVTSANPIFRSTYSASHSSANSEIDPFTFSDTRTYAASQDAANVSAALIVSSLPQIANGVSISDHSALVVTAQASNVSGTYTMGRFSGIRTHVNGGGGASATSIVTGIFNHVGNLGGTVTDLIGYDCYTANVAGTITNAIAIRIPATWGGSNATNNWALQIDNFQSQHRGNFGIGGAAITTIPAAKLDVVGDARISTTLNVAGSMIAGSASGATGARLHAFDSTGGATLFALEQGTLNNLGSDGNEKVAGGRQTTTNASAQNFLVGPLFADGTAVQVVAELVGRTSAGAVLSMRRTFICHVASGALTVVASGTQETVGTAALNTSVVSIAAFVNTFIVQVAGVAATTIKWTGMVRYRLVTTF